MATAPIPRVAPALIRGATRAGDDYGATDPPDWRTIDWHAHLRTAEVLGTRVNYVDIEGIDAVLAGSATRRRSSRKPGRSRPLVLIHGLGGQWQNWLENIPRFARDRRVIAMDLPGFGVSPMPDEDVSIEYYGRVVAELCTQLDLAPAVIVGNSMGGFIGAEVAIRRPEIAERLLLVSAAGVSQIDLAKRPVLAGAKIAGFAIRTSLGQMKWAARHPRARHWSLAFVVRHPTRIKPDTAFEGLMKGTNKPAFEPSLEALLSYDFRDRLGGIGCPCLVVWGEKDMIIPVADADTYVERIPGARKIVMEDTGHVPMLERPATFNDILAEFLEHEIQEGEIEGRLDSEEAQAARRSAEAGEESAGEGALGGAADRARVLAEDA